jgi:hypothetical protein
MISVSFKKQLIVNAYNTQLITDNDKIYTTSFSSIKRIKNELLFRKDESLWLVYKFKKKDNIINHDINWVLNYLTYPIFSIYKYSGDKEYDIQQNILSHIQNVLDTKQNIDKYKDYAEYLEDIYD